MNQTNKQTKTQIQQRKYCHWPPTKKEKFQGLVPVTLCGTAFRSCTSSFSDTNEIPSSFPWGYQVQLSLYHKWSHQNSRFGARTTSRSLSVETCISTVYLRSSVCIKNNSFCAKCRQHLVSWWWHCLLYSIPSHRIIFHQIRKPNHSLTACLMYPFILGANPEGREICIDFS